MNEWADFSKYLLVSDWEIFTFFLLWFMMRLDLFHSGDANSYSTFVCRVLELQKWHLGAITSGNMENQSALPLWFCYVYFNASRSGYLKLLKGKSSTIKSWSEKYSFTGLLRSLRGMFLKLQTMPLEVTYFAIYFDKLLEILRSIICYHSESTGGRICKVVTLKYCNALLGSYCLACLLRVNGKKIHQDRATLIKPFKN